MSNKSFLLLILLLFFGLSLGCSKKSTNAKKSKELRKSLKGKSPSERKIIRWERKLKQSPREREAIGNIKYGRPYSDKQYKIYTRYYRKKSRIDRKYDRLVRKQQRKLQTAKTNKRMKRNRKKAEKSNRFQRNKKINK